MFFKKPHRHAHAIHAFADGAQIQMLSSSRNAWIDVNQPDWAADIEYRVKPQEDQYPKSTLHYVNLCAIVNEASKIPGNESVQTKVARLAADTAIAVFIESGEMRKYVQERGFL